MKVVILAGGLGSRISEYTKTIPKPMVKLGKYPILIHIMKHYEKYGPVSRLDMVKNQRVLMCLGPEFNEATLFDPKGNFSVAGGYASSLGGLYPDGMLTRDDVKHKRTRRASQPAFKNDALKTYVDMLIPIQERRIQDLPINEEFIFYDNIQKTLMDVAARVFIGLDELSPEAKKLGHLFSEINEGLITPLPYDLPFLQFRKSLKAREELRQFFIENIPKRRGSNGLGHVYKILQRKR